MSPEPPSSPHTALVPTCPGSLYGHPSSFYRGLLGLVKPHFTFLDSGGNEGAKGLVSFAELLCHQPGRGGMVAQPDKAVALSMWGFLDKSRSFQPIYSMGCLGT